MAPARRLAPDRDVRRGAPGQRIRAVRSDDDLFFGINISGSSLAGQRGREVTIGDGDAVAIDPAAGAFSILRAAPARMIGVRIPRRSVPAGAVSSGAGPLHLVPAGTAALQLLTSYLRGALSGSTLSAAPLADAVASHVAEPITLSLDPVYAATPPAGVPACERPGWPRSRSSRREVEVRCSAQLLTAGVQGAVKRVASCYLGRRAGAAYADSAVGGLLIRLEPGDVRWWQ